MNSILALKSGCSNELADSESRKTVPLPRRTILRFWLQLLLIAMDSVAVVVGIGLANFARFGAVDSKTALSIGAALLPLYLMLAFNADAFRTDTLVSYQRGIYRSLKALLFASMLVVVSVYFLKIGEQISRAAVLFSGVVGGGNLIAARVIVPFVIRHRYGVTLRSDVLIIDGVTYSAPQNMFVIDAAKAALECDLRNPLMLDRLGRLLKGADRVIVACPPDRRRNWAMILKGANIHGEVLAPELDALGPLGTGKIQDSSTITVATGSLELRQRFVKRVVDLALCCLGLMTLAPLMLLVAVAIKLDSPGPIFFVQQRVGRGNQLFSMMKFRSMRIDGCDQRGDQSTERGDDRITRVGAFIRATSVDELPQLINVLKGEMSVVGPRPHALGSLAGDAPFWEIDERYWHRHACKPGLTGLAQVRGLRGATHHRSDLIDRLQSDLEYLVDWSVWKDIAIMFATLRVLTHRNAY